MFRTADPSRKVPVWLQAYTKENVIWQLKMAVLSYVAIEAYAYYQEKKYQKFLKSI